MYQRAQDSCLEKCSNLTLSDRLSKVATPRSRFKSGITPGKFAKNQQLPRELLTGTEEAV